MSVIVIDCSNNHYTSNQKNHRLKGNVYKAIKNIILLYECIGLN